MSSFQSGGHAIVALVMIFASVGNAVWANALMYPQYTADDLLIVEGPRELMRGAQVQNVDAGWDNMELKANAPSGSLLTGQIKTRFPFNEAIPTWNAWAPLGGAIRVWMRAGSDTQATDWFEAGSWGELADMPSTRVLNLKGGKYDVDTLLLDTPADWVQFRVDLVRSPKATASPRFWMLALSYSNTTGNPEIWKRYGSDKPMVSKELADLRSTESLGLPLRSQVVPEQKWIGRICAPASVSMATWKFGNTFGSYEMAQLLYDKPSDAFGVWNRSIQGAAQLGVRGYITRFRSWDDVRKSIKQGNVICASIRFKHGELQAPPREYRKHGTEGHLIVLDGFAPGGRILVNNSATKDYGHDELWLQEDLAKAWFEKGGVAYVFTGKGKVKPSTRR